MSEQKVIEIPVHGMDCAECTMHVKKAISSLQGVSSVEVFLTSEKAVVHLDPARVDLPSIRKAVAGAGYRVPEEIRPEEHGGQLDRFTRPVQVLMGIVFGLVLFIVIAGEWLGLFDTLTGWIPFPVGVLLVLLAGFPAFRNVIRAALNRQIISHTLMSLGVLAALVVGEWVTALVVVFFMRIGDYVEGFTASRARRAVKDLVALAPQTARVERPEGEVELPIGQVAVGDTVIVRPGEKIPVDGEVLSGQATVNQATITGEGIPVEAGPGSRVFAATIAQFGSLRVRAGQVGADTTFGRVIKLVEEAEAHRADVQRIADRFSGYYLPVVAGIALLTFLLSRNALATAAVLVVACSCSFALATPIAMLATIGAGAKRGLMIKGGKYIELLAKADVLLIDKTGTLTLGEPEVTDIEVMSGPDGSGLVRLSASELLALAASAERYSEHPLAAAVRSAALRQGVVLSEPVNFAAEPGRGVRAVVDGRRVEVGSSRLVSETASAAVEDGIALLLTKAEELQAQGKTLLFVQVDGRPAGILAAADTLRPEVPAAIQAVRELGIRHVELLTGDNERSAAALAGEVDIPYRANLLPEDKIRIIREYQAHGHTVVMVGDGVNDAPALAQADVGIAMGVVGSDIAIEAAHVALMRADWNLVPEVLRLSRRTLRVVKTNIIFTGVYNLIGLSLAAFGFLPPIIAAAAQSLPDLGILANSSRLIRQ